MREVKEAQERRREILDVAEELFVTNGYDNTSTNDILNRIGIARGTLYYHFKSKEDILNSMIERINDGLIAKARTIASDTSIPVIDRLVMTIAGMQVDTEIGQEIIDQVHKPQNALMHQKMQQHLLNGVIPIIAGIVEEGNEQGIFNIKYPAETTEMLILYSGIVFDDDFDESQERVQNRIQAFLYNMELLLGAKEGTIQKSMMKLFNR
ncbi:transcriptional regulator, TetR family [Lachnospiraceae bacterium XBB2008]|nr:transcriptional regulator, TetR family [Lachnospiraceae bacterium XBB2008]